MTLLAATVATFGLGACDRSKPELEATRQQLQTVTAARDSLNAELEASKQRAAGLQQQVTELQGRLSAAVAALVPPEVVGQPGAQGDKKGDKKVDKKVDKTGTDAPKPSAAAPAR